MNDSSECSCEHCGSEDVSRIWNMFIRASGVTPDLVRAQLKAVLPALNLKVVADLVAPHLAQIAESRKKIAPDGNILF